MDEAPKELNAKAYTMTLKEEKALCHKLYSACISTTSGPIFTNQVVLESPKWGLSAHMWEVQEQQQMTEISGHQ